MSLGARLLVIRARVHTWRAARERRRTLERELADYAGAAQRRDLEATLDRYPDGVTGELRDILAHQALAAAAPAWPATGRRL